MVVRVVAVRVVTLRVVTLRDVMVGVVRVGAWSRVGSGERSRLGSRRSGGRSGRRARS